MTTFVASVSDGFNIARRNVIKIRRAPETLVAVLFSPLLMVVMFSYIFGSSIDIPGVSYDGYLISGAFAMVLVFGSTFTAAGLADDKQKGITNRFRSLPMSRSAVIVGRTVTDVIYNVLSLIVMAGAGLVLGWRINGGVGDAVLAFLLLLTFAYAFSWIMAYVGMVAPSVEVVNNAASMVILPLTFISNTLVPAENLVTPLRIIAEWNPISAVTQASRELFGNLPTGAAEPASWPLQNPVAATLLWTVLIIAVFAPLSIRRFNRS